MAILYLRSTDGNDADNGSTWALAKATLEGAFAAASPGDTIFVSHVHASALAGNLSLLSPGTAASPVWIICVNDGAEPPTTLATTATVSNTGGTNMFKGGYAYSYGVNYDSGTTGARQISYTLNSGVGHWIYEECQLKMTGAGGLLIGPGANLATDSGVTFRKNVSIAFGATGGTISVNGGRFIWRNTATPFGTNPPTVLFSGGSNRGTAIVDIAGVNLSQLGSGATLFNMTTMAMLATLRNCKLGSSVAITTGSAAGPNGTRVSMINCDSADTNYRQWTQDYSGTIEHETTIVRTGGATDGTTPISREMISSANARPFAPLVLRDLVFWNETVGSAVTLTVHTVTDNVTLTDKECWLEIEYLGTSGFPLSLFADDRDNLTDILLGGSASNQTTSTETWTTTGLTTPVKQQLAVTVTPQEKGPIRCRVMLAKASTTVYVCPKVEVS